jgi:hypothetical protein
MAENPVAVENRINLAERHQIGRIQLEIGMQVEGAAMMDFQFLGASADFTNRMERQMLLAHRRPVTRARSSDRMLALGSID